MSSFYHDFTRGSQEDGTSPNGLEQERTGTCGHNFKHSFTAQGAENDRSRPRCRRLASGSSYQRSEQVQGHEGPEHHFIFHQ